MAAAAGAGALSKAQGQAKETTEQAEILALLEIIKLVSKKAETEVDRKKLEADILEKCQKFSTHLNKPIFALTIINICKKTGNMSLETLKNIFLIGNLFPNTFAEAFLLETTHPILEHPLLQDYERKLQQEKQNTINFTKDMQIAIALKEEKKKLNTKKNTDQTAVQLKICQDRCKVALEETTKHVKELAAVSKKYDSDISLMLTIGPENVIKHIATIKEIALLTVVESNASTKTFSTQLTSSKFYSLTYYYCDKFNLFCKKKEVDDLIASLPESMRKEAETVVKKNRAVMIAVWQDINKLLTLLNKRFFVIYQRYMKNMYNEVLQKADTFTTPRLSEINMHLFASIEKIAADAREKLKKDLQYVEDMINKIGGGAVNSSKDSILSQFDNAVKEILELADEFELNTFAKFKGNCAVQGALEEFLDEFTRTVVCAREILQTGAYDGDKDVVQYFEEYAVKAGNSFEEVKRAQQQRLKEIEGKRREKAKEATQAAAEILHAQKAMQEIAQKEKAAIDKVKNEVLSNFQNLKGKDKERNLLIRIFNDEDLHRVAEEAVFERLVGFFGLSCTPTASGILIKIHKEAFSYHRWHGRDRPGTLDGEVTKKFKTALEKIGITKADIDRVNAAEKPLVGVAKAS